mgnify:CR=1 FL=1
MKTRIITTFLIATLLISAIPAFSQSTEQLFQKGIMAEEGEGNLPAAIDIFNAIVENANAEEALQAKALLHVGLCYEKLGKQEASKAYQKLVNNFPAQKNEVTIAKERLSRLILAEKKTTPISPKPKFTKIKIPTKLSWAVKLSPDGKELALVSDKKLWKMPLSSNLGVNISGTPVQLNTGGIEVEWTGLDWSRDGKWIAFNDYPKHDENGRYIENQSILIVPSDGGEPKKLVENFRSARVINYRISLSPDAKKIAFSSIDENQQQHVFSMDINTRTSKQLAEMEAREPAFSPDGKYIAFVKDKNMGIDEGDLGLWLVKAEGGTPVKLADAGKASSPVWSPDGKMIAYLDNSKGTQINIAPVNLNGNATDQKISIDAPEGIEEVRLLAGWTPDNRLGALMVSKLEFSLFTLPAKGGQAAMILNDVRAYQPRWSRDSKQIFYVTPPLDGTGRSYRQFIASVPSSGGKGSPLKTNINGESVKQFAYQSGNRVSPDGKWIVTSTWTPKDTNTLNVHWPTSKIWKVSVDGEEAIQITNTPGNFSDMSPCWSPDGKKIAFVRFQLVAGENDIFGGDPGIYCINSTGGEPELLVSVTGKYVNSVIWSPDGKTIAYQTKEINEPHTKKLNLYNIETNESLTIGSIESVNVNIEMAWSPDGKRIAFNDQEGKVIKIMNIEDGTVEDVITGLVDVNIYHLDWSPDGKRFVFGGLKGGNAEFWFLENFLPLDKLAHKEATTETPKTLTIKKVVAGETTLMWGSPSPDGQYITYSDPATLNLGIRELGTGKTSILTNEAAENPLQFNMASVVSPDNKHIAYAWYKNNHELRIINKDDPQPETLYANKDEDIWPCAWSPDGKIVYARSILNNTGQTRILAVNATTGETHIIKSFEHIFWIELCVSPDNNFIAYNFPNNADIHLISTDGKNESIIVNHPANDHILGWFPDKNQLFFKSDRSGTWDVWTIEVNNAKVSGAPKKVLSEFGKNASPMGFTKNGIFYYSLLSRKFNGFVLPFDQAEGAIQGELARPLQGSIRTAKWSPDGKSIALIKEIWNEDKRPLSVLNTKTGKENKMADWLYAWNIQWSPDCRNLLVEGMDKRKESGKDSRGGIYTIEIESGKITELLSVSDSKESYERAGSLWAKTLAEWTDDQKRYYYIKNDQLVSRDLETGQDKILLQNKNLNKFPYKLDLSPAGKKLLYINNDEIYIIPTTGNKEYLVTKVNTETGSGPNVRNCAVWSPDMNYLFYTENNGSEGAVLWRINTEGENKKEVWYSKFPISSLSIHPNGKQIIITELGQGVEIRKVENLSQEVEKIYAENEE